MRFSLRTLLLLFPALIVSYGLAQGCWPAIYSHRGGRSSWSRENHQLRRFQQIAEETIPPTTLAALAPTIDDALQGKAPLPPALDARFGKSPLSDSWSQPYRCIAREERLHFYSCGQDGQTQSVGNDPDDLNTWDEHANEYYGEQRRMEHFRQQRLEALWFMPLTLAFVVGCWVALRKLVA